ncbi:MAG: carboxypeptidase regulatory-like domain-containing protein [Blastocatellia bacterium]|nr:carboxypeptidase regulatory-like domain-containing protein [Blastocatellia bacterium]
MKHTLQNWLRLALGCALVVCLAAVTAQAQQNRRNVALRGQVLDESGAGLAGAEVTAIDGGGKETQVIASEKGDFEFRVLPEGDYILKVAVPGFANYQSQTVKIGGGPVAPLVIKMSVGNVVEQVTVDASSPLTLSNENNASALTFKGKDLEALPDDPDELASALQELAGPGAGPNGAQLFVDGFNGVRLPPKSSIREIRINSNPFAAEYDRIGFGRIEILTKPGIDQLHGESFFNFNDESLNARNAFAPFRGPLQVRRYGGNLTGTLIPKKASFFVDFERRETDENTSVNATILDSNLVALPFSAVVLTPQRLTTFSPRFDFQLSERTTLVTRYSFSDISNQNQGVGNFSLASRASDTTSRSNVLNLTLTTIVNPKIVNEARLQLTRQTSLTEGDNSTPSLNVLGAFNGGGAQVGINSRTEQRLEFQDYLSIAHGNHSFKAGLRLRGTRVADSNTGNFGGSYTFAGDVERNPVTGLPSGGPITSLEQLRRTLLGLPGYRPSQFTLNAGDPFTSVNQFDVGTFFQDEWRVRQNFTLSIGLRHEAQTNLGAKYNFAPRLGFAWSPRRASSNNSSGSGNSSTVIRGGFGIFYDRFDDSYTLTSRRFDGNRVINYFAINPGFFPTIPNPSQLNSQTPIRRTIAPELQAPYQLQAAIGIERQLPFKLVGNVNYVWSRGVHLLRTRNVNAPLPGTFTGVPGSGVRPLGNIGDIYQYESTGISNMHQIRVGLSRRLAQGFTVFSNYTWTKADSDTDNAGTFPQNSFDLAGEYGRSLLQTTHQFFIGGQASLPLGLRLSPFIVLRSGRPFNITTGRDTNGDTVFTERPAFAEAGAPGSITTAFGTFNPNPKPGETIIPRNYGEGPGFASVNLAVSRTFGFGTKSKGDANVAAGGSTQMMSGGFGGGGGPRGGGGGGGGPRGGGGGFGGGGRGGFGDATASDSRFNLTLTVRVNNLFNHTNLGGFTGQLTSPIFGLANTAAEARRIEGQLRFRF